MLTLRDEQIEVFEQHLFEAMQQRVERAIAATFPEFAEPAPQVKAIVERGIENAVGVDIVDGPDFAAFIALGLALRLAPPGPSASWIHAWLKRPEPGQTRLRMIESRLRTLAKDDRVLAAIARRVALARERMAG